MCKNNDTCQVINDVHIYKRISGLVDQIVHRHARTNLFLINHVYDLLYLCQDRLDFCGKGERSLW